jgi:hypothetical protein
MVRFRSCKSSSLFSLYVSYLPISVEMLGLLLIWDIFLALYELSMYIFWTSNSMNYKTEIKKSDLVLKSLQIKFYDKKHQV